MDWLTVYRQDIRMEGSVDGTVVSGYHRRANERDVLTVAAWTLNTVGGGVQPSIGLPGASVIIGEPFALQPCSEPAPLVTTLVATPTISGNQTIVIFAKANNAALEAFSFTVSVRLVGGPASSTTAVHEFHCPPRQGMTDYCRVNLRLPSAWQHADRSVHGSAVVLTTSVGDREVTIPILPVRDADPLVAVDELKAHIAPTALLQGDAFEILVYANASTSLTSVVLDMSISGPLAIDAVTVGHDGKWTGSVAVSNGSASLAIVRDAASALVTASSAVTRGRELIATVTGRALQSVTAGAATVRLSVSHSSTTGATSPVHTAVHIVGQAGVAEHGVAALTVAVPHVMHMVIDVERYELFNVAVLSQRPVAVRFAVTAVMSNGSLVQLGSTRLTCTSTVPNVMSVNCTHVLLAGTETAGSANATFTVRDAESGFLAVQTVTVRFPYHETRVVLQARQLRPITGWSVPNVAPDCADTRPRYQETRFGILADFGTHAFDESPIEIDVASLMRSHITLEPEGVATLVDRSTMIRGVAEGSAVLRVWNARQVQVGWSRILVAGPAVPVTSLTVNLITAITHIADPVLGNQTARCDLVQTPSLNSRGQVQVAIEENVFVRENQSAVVVVTAWLADGSSVLLDPADGVEVHSTDLAAVHITTDGLSWRATVPMAARSVVGSVAVTATLVPGCNQQTTPLASGVVNVRVELERPLGIAMHFGEDRLSTGGGIRIVSPQDASKILGAASSAPFTVSLVFKDRSVDVTHDSRVNYSGTIPSEYVQVTAGRIAAVDTRPMDLVGTLSATFTGDVVLNDETPVLLEKSHRVLLQPRSTTTQIGTVGTAMTGEPLFDSMRLTMTLELTGGELLAVPDAYGSYSTLHNGTTFAFHDSLDLVTFAHPGPYVFRGYFLGMSSSSFVMGVTEDPVYVSRILSFDLKQDNISVSYTNALHGQRHQAQAQLYLAVELSTGVVLENIFDHLQQYGHLFQLEVMDHRTAVQPVDVDHSSGRVTLRGNAPVPAEITAVTTATPTGTVYSRRVRFSVNVELAGVGDVDLGSSVGEPLRRRKLGAVFKAPLRVNMGVDELSAFDIRITFDTSVLSVENPMDDVQFDANDAHGMLFADVRDSELRIIGTMLPWGSHNSSALLTIRFKAVGIGISRISGRVDVLKSSSLRSVGDAGHIFVAGTVYQEVFQNTDTVATRSLKRREIPVDSFGTISSPTSGIPCRMTGDVNGDCVLDVADVQLLYLYLAFRGLNFQGALGASVLDVVEAVPHALDNFDADHSGEIDGRDALYLFTVVYGGLSHLAHFEVSPISVATDCMQTLDAVLTTPNAWLDQHASVKVFFVLTHADPRFAQSFNTALSIVKGQQIAQQSSVTAVVLRADQRNGSRLESTYSAKLALSATHSFPQVGVSIVQVVHGANGRVRHAVMTRSRPLDAEITRQVPSTGVLEFPGVGVLTQAALPSANAFPLAEYTNNQDSLICNVHRSNCTAETAAVPATSLALAVCAGTGLTGPGACTGNALGTFVVEETRLIAGELGRLSSQLELAALYKARAVLASASIAINLTCAEMSVDGTTTRYTLYVDDNQAWRESGCVQAAVVLRLVTEAAQVTLAAESVHMTPTTFNSASCAVVESPQDGSDVEAAACPGLLFGYLELNASSSVSASTSLDINASLRRINTVLDGAQADFAATCMTVVTASRLRIGYSARASANCAAASAILDFMLSTGGGAQVVTTANTLVQVDHFSAAPCVDGTTTAATTPEGGRVVNETNTGSSDSGATLTPATSAALIYTSILVVLCCALVFVVVLIRRSYYPPKQKATAVDRLSELEGLAKIPSHVDEGSPQPQYAFEEMWHAQRNPDPAVDLNRTPTDPHSGFMSPGRIDGIVKWDLDGRSLPALSRGSASDHQRPRSMLSDSMLSFQHHSIFPHSPPFGDQVTWQEMRADIGSTTLPNGSPRVSRGGAGAAETMPGSAPRRQPSLADSPAYTSIDEDAGMVFSDLRPAYHAARLSGRNHSALDEFRVQQSVVDHTYEAVSVYDDSSSIGSGTES